MEENKDFKTSRGNYWPPSIVEKKELTVELFSDEPPVEPPWPGP